MQINYRSLSSHMADWEFHHINGGLKLFKWENNLLEISCMVFSIAMFVHNCLFCLVCSIHIEYVQLFGEHSLHVSGFDVE